MHSYGVSFSIKQCRNFDIDPDDCLDYLIKDLGFRRFRLMSYWNEIEKEPGEYDFKHLDAQIRRIKRTKGSVTLCLGVRQPRWPENHWPDWAYELSEPARSQAVMNFVATIVERYKTEKIIVSYQLENEALLANFGERSDVNRTRLRAEYDLVKHLDPSRPIIMTTSTSWGIPIRRPIPDIVGFSYYQTVYRADLGKYTTAFHKPWMDRLRALLVRIIWRKPSFLHELQMEPWGPKNIWEMSIGEQDQSMNTAQLERNLELAKKTGLSTIDLWGGEWWYWRHSNGDHALTKDLRSLLLRS